jgi:hypothetical protein
MFERLGQFAETMAMRTSRRDFLSGLGKAAAVAAVGLVGVMAASTARAQTSGTSTCCSYQCPSLNGGKSYTAKLCVSPGLTCPVVIGRGSCPLINSKPVNNCNGCK